MEDSRPIFFCKRFSYNENALYLYRSRNRTFFTLYLAESLAITV